MWLLKTNFEGTLEWNQTYGGSSQDGASALLRTDDGCFILASFTVDCGGSTDVWLVKTEPVSIKTSSSINGFSLFILIFSLSMVVFLNRFHYRKIRM